MWHAQVSNKDHDQGNELEQQARSGKLDLTESFAWIKARDLPEFQHEPLSNSSSIRILIIESADSINAPLKVRIEEIDLDKEIPEYVALSHAWGNKPKYDHFVVCSNKQYAITQRVDYALRRIRAVCQSQAEQYGHFHRIWVDSICIDQNTTMDAQSEKSKQVEMMHHIFGCATEVVIDLGPTSQSTSEVPTTEAEVMELQSILQESKRKRNVSETINFLCNSPTPNQAEEKGKVLPALVLAAVGKLFGREWFRRIWTLQELVLARKTTYLIGLQALSGPQIDVLFGLLFEEDRSTLNKSTDDIVRMLIGSRHWHAQHKFEFAAGIRDAVANNDLRGRSLPMMMAIGSFFQCSKAHDYLYAVYAMTDLSPGSFRVDYNESIEDVSRRTALHLLKGYSTEMLMNSAVGISTTATQLQSSWGSALDGLEMVHLEDSKMIMLLNSLPYTASGESITISAEPCTHVSHHQCINGKGLRIASVTAVSEPCLTNFEKRSKDGESSEKIPILTRPTNSDISHALGWIWLQKAVLPILRRDTSLTLTSEVLWRTILHDRDALTDARLSLDTNTLNKYLTIFPILEKNLQTLDYDPGTYSSYTEAIESLAHWTSRSVVERMRSLAPEAFDELLAATNELNRIVFETKEAFFFTWQRVLDRSICVTDKGHIGSVRGTTQPGDEIMIFSGCCMPFVMRKEGDFYRIVGSCYIDGIMYGEAMEGDPRWEDIHII